MISNQELKLQGRTSLNGNWGLAICAVLVVWLLTAAFVEGRSGTDQSLFSNIMSIISLLLTGPLTYGLANIYLKFRRSEAANLADLFTGSTYFLQTFLLHVIKYIFIVLWILLLIIPGIIAILRYSMAYYIMVDNPSISGLEAIRRSGKMMYGHKTRLFFLWLSFLGWFIFGVATFGIGFLYVAPYYEATLASFYENLKHGTDGYVRSGNSNGSDFEQFINS